MLSGIRSKIIPSYGYYEYVIIKNPIILVITGNYSQSPIIYSFFKNNSHS